MTLDEVKQLRERLEALNKASALPLPPPPAIHRAAPSTAPAADEDDSPAELRAIMQVESSGGKNLKHPTVDHGLNAGTHAGGGYAVMPLTFRDVVRRNASLKTKYGHVADQEPDSISDYLNSNQGSSKEVATHYYKELSDRFKGDHVKVAHAWNHGPGNTAKLKDDEIQSSDYVKKYLTAYKGEKAKDEAKAKRKGVQDMMSSAAASFKPTPMVTDGAHGSFSGGLGKALDEGIFDAEDEELFKSKERHQQLYTDNLSEHKGKKVFVYFNLHHKVWSVRHKGKVIAHTKQVHLGDAKFKVSEPGRQRVLKEKQKNIHAGVEGTITEPRKMPDHNVRVSYNPYAAGHFYRADHPDKPAIHDANHVHMEVNEGTDPNGHQVRFPRVHAIQNTPARLKKSRLDSLVKVGEHPAEPKVAQKLEWRNVALGRAAHTDTHTYHHVYAGGKHGLNIASHEELNDRARSHFREYPHQGSEDNAERVAQRHHIRETYGLNRRDEHVADMAWPGTDDRGRGIERFIGAHPDSVRADMDRAHAGMPSPEDQLSMRIKDFSKGHAQRERFETLNKVNAIDPSTPLKWGGNDGGISWTSHGQYQLDENRHYGTSLSYRSHRSRSAQRNVWGDVHVSASGAEHFPGTGKGWHVTIEAAKQAANNHHAITHYGLTRKDVKATHKAWPEEGPARFHGMHPDMVRAELVRAHSALEKAIGDLDHGDHVDRKTDKDSSTWDHYDYNHLLTPEHRDAGYTMQIRQRVRKPEERVHYEAHLQHHGKWAGSVEGFVHGNVVEPHSHLEEEHRGKKLGVAMYEALLTHGKRKMGITHVKGGFHSQAASRVHQSLARKHGMDYSGKPEDWRTREKGYSYAIKSEAFAKAIKDIKPGKKVRSTGAKDVYDYSHVLKPEHRKAGYSLEVHHSPNTTMNAYVFHQGKEAGIAFTGIHSHQDEPDAPPKRYLEPHSRIESEHRGKGLGVAAYEALYAHAMSNGITHVRGGPHSTDAGRVHESLARKHGLKYNTDKTPGIFDRGNYRYLIKSEKIKPSEDLQWEHRYEGMPGEDHQSETSYEPGVYSSYFINYPRHTSGTPDSSFVLTHESYSPGKRTSAGQGIRSTNHGHFATVDEAKSAAHEHHIARSYGLKSHEVAAAQKAWPEGVKRFHGMHPSHVKADVARALEAYPPPEGLTVIGK